MRHLMFLPAAALALFTVGFAPSAEAVTVSGTPPTFDLAAGQVSARFRNGASGTTGAGEIYVGPDGDVGSPPRAEAQFDWAGAGTDPIAFSFVYDSDGGAAGLGALTATLGGSSATYELTAATSLSFDALQLNVRGTADDLMTVQNLVIAGMTVPGAFGPASGFTDYGITGFGTLADFMISGELVRSDVTSTSQEAVRVDLVMGVQPIPLPAGAWVLISGFAAAAGLRRMTRKAA